MMIYKRYQIFSLLLIAVMMACSSSTHLTKSWMDPSLTTEMIEPLKKIIVIAKIKDQTSDRIAEDQIVLNMKPGVAYPSYSIIQYNDTIPETIDEKLKKEGFDGILVMQLTEVDKSLNIEPATYAYRGFYGRRYAYGYPSSVSEDHTFKVQTSIYSLKSNKLLWSGTTSTYNPSQFDAALNDIILAIKNDLMNKGLLQE